MFNENVKIKVPIYVLKYLTNLHSKDFQNYRSSEGYVNEADLGAVSIRKTVLPGMAIPMLKIRRPNGRLIFNMEIAIRR